MALWLETDTNANKDINAAVSVGAYTATRDVFVLPQILADQVAGGGDYVYYVTLQVAGAGSHYVIGPKTTHTAAAGETALAAQGGLIFMRNADVLTVYIDGLAGDTTTPDVTVRFAAIPLPSAAAGAIGGLPVLDANLYVSANVLHQAGEDVATPANTIANIWAHEVAPGNAASTYLVSSVTLMDGIIEGGGEEPYKLTAAALADVIGADSDTLKTLSDQLDAVDSDVWGYVTRTLTQGSTTTTDATASGAITRKRGNSWSISLTLGAITGYTSLWFTVKRSYDDADTASVVQIKKNASGLTDGLLYVNGAAATNAALASITVSDATTGAIVVAVDETITDDLAPGTYYYDVQALISGSVSTPDAGTFTLTADVTRSVT